jgi:hypothetical protein
MIGGFSGGLLKIFECVGVDGGDMIHDLGTIMKLTMSVGAGDVIRDIGAITELTLSVGDGDEIRDVGPNAELTCHRSMAIIPWNEEVSGTLKLDWPSKFTSVVHNMHRGELVIGL